MREKLEAAFERAHTKSAQWMVWYGTAHDQAIGRRFTRLLDAEAWLEAALLLVPEGWNIDMGFRSSQGRYWAHMAKPEHDPLLVGRYFGFAPTPAEALLAAIEKARTV